MLGRECKMPMVIEMEKNEKKDKKGFDEFEVKDALHTLIKAEKIKNDSKLMAEVQKLAKSEKKAISSIAELKSKASEVAAEEDSEA